MLSLTRLLLATPLFLNIGCTRSDTDDSGTDTNVPTAQVELDEAVRSQRITSNTGAFWSTDMSPDVVVLRELGTAFEFLDREFSVWARRVLDNAAGEANPCISIKPPSTNGSVDTYPFEVKSCFVGKNRSRKISGEGNALLDSAKNSLEFEVDWSMKMGSVSNSGTYQASWTDLAASLSSDATLDASIEYNGSTYGGRTLTLSGAQVLVSDMPDVPPDYIFGNPEDGSTGATITWSDREDRLDLGLSLSNTDDRYAGLFWGNYVSPSSTIFEFATSTFEENTDGEILLNGSGSVQTESRGLNLASYSQHWGAQNFSFTGELTFNYTHAETLSLGDWETELTMMAYSITPIIMEGSARHIEFNGPIEMGLFHQDQAGEEREEWVFGACETLKMELSDNLPYDGNCRLENADGALLGLVFSEETPSSGWLLIQRSETEWICRNLKTDEEQVLSSAENETPACPAE